ncbi:hypothetical protein LMG31506_05213 [Cupriavidus yeoncheonensis]|uniref:DUF2188 domain-containing protein n=1 Tax=Cupriavidus yeoncheonensis TaxID=1462994 RepID=A0A916J1Q8_9BURK|nr:DUF2188 domain-containing protein [Cupriavidus yeoncheonensis]CAG2154861.1 hypothetical protein LMG31506_05213 [Cupriavidus yeoncheonensis]
MVGHNVHVVPAGDRWAVVADGGHGRETFRTQEEAVASGTEKARQREVDLFVHGRDGQTRARNSYGQDPHNIRGRPM